MAKRDDKNKQDAPKVEVKKSRRKDAAVTDMKDIGAAAGTPVAPKMSALDFSQAQPEAIKREQQIDSKGRAYGTGRRKDAVARVWLQRGSGKVTVNGRDQSIYFARHTQRLILNQPFLIVESVGHYDIVCTVKGGGLSGQAGAVRHGISRALEKFDPSYRPALKKAGMLTRDARIVERKKVGKHGARRTKQWAKR
jgi:small subunit ribosomal protein S9